MTAQINDEFLYHDCAFALAGISEGAVFDPSIFGLNPTPAGSCCWRGYHVVYSLLESHLVLDRMYIRLTSDGRTSEVVGPPINGISPQAPKRYGRGFNNHYEGLAYRLNYTGGLLLATGFINDLYVHMGFHPAWKYGRVFELLFEDGKIVGEHDRSARMAEVRESFSMSRSEQDRTEMPTQKEIELFVERSFDRSYRRSH